METINYMYQISAIMKCMVGLCKDLISIEEYFEGKIKSFPLQKLNSSKKQKQDTVASRLLLKYLNASLTKLNQGISESDEQQLFDIQNIKKIIDPNSSILYEEFQNIISFYQNLPEEQKLLEEEVTNQCEKISDILKKIFMKEKEQNQYNFQELFKNINILTKEENMNWEPFAAGGFGFLQRAYAEYELKDHVKEDKENNQEYLYENGEIGERLEGYIVRKSDRKAQKIINQHKIFKMLQGQSHSNIQPHYISNQQIYQKYIFSKFTPNMSLDHYIRVNKRSISLETFIKLIKDGVNGLLFLKAKNIVHLDIKPHNILINQDLVAKISDFGEAFYQQQDVLKHKYGITVPYTPSEVFYTEPYLNYKVDVYAIGVTLFKIIFGYHLWGDILDSQQFRQKMIEKKPVLQLCPQKLYQYGMPQIIGILVNLVLRCASRQQNSRPSLFYISVILTLCKNYIQSLIYDDIIQIQS